MFECCFGLKEGTYCYTPSTKIVYFFDTKFCTNRYNMPFAPIVGINNHMPTVVFGYALLANETKEGFKWVLERWLGAMDGVQPEHIMTDQDVECFVLSFDIHSHRYDTGGQRCIAA
jgi:hypothetical protein